jgi:uncharacterized protein (DUF305 family)
MIYRGVEIRGTVQRHTFNNLHKVFEVESVLETDYKGFIDALLISLCSWSTKSDKMFVETMNPHRTSSVESAKKPLKRGRRTTTS